MTDFNSGELKIALIDSDILVYRCGFAAEERRYVATYGERSESFRKRRDAQEWLANASAELSGSDAGLRQPTCEAGQSVGLDTGERSSECVLPDGGAGSIRYAPSAEPIEHACQNARTTVRSIATYLHNKVGTHKAEFYLSGKNNFRYELATLKPYKGNRKDVPKPIHYDALREFIQHAYRAEVVDGQEADDAIGIRATELRGAAIIVSIDKDLDTIPGLHYNWVKEKLYNVSEREASRNFYCQLLTGDDTDNIPGITGIGTITAKRILRGFSSDKGMWQTVLAEYTKHYPDGFMGKDTKQAVIEIARLLYIRRHTDEQWSPP